MGSRGPSRVPGPKSQVPRPRSKVRHRRPDGHPQTVWCGKRSAGPACILRSAKIGHRRWTWDLGPGTAQIGAAVDQMRREGVPERVRAHFPGQPRAPNGGAQAAPERLARQRPSVSIREEIRAQPPPQQRRPGVLEIRQHPRPRGTADRHRPFLAPLADDRQEARLEVHLAHLQRHQLRHAQSGRVQHLDHRHVAAKDRRVRRLDEQCGHLLRRQRAWQALAEPWQVQVAGRIARHHPVPDEKPEEDADCRQHAGAAPRGQAAGLERFQKRDDVARLRGRRRLHAPALAHLGEDREVTRVRGQRVGRQPALGGQVRQETVDVDVEARGGGRLGRRHAHDPVTRRRRPRPPEPPDAWSAGCRARCEPAPTPRDR